MSENQVYKIKVKETVETEREVEFILPRYVREDSQTVSKITGESEVIVVTNLEMSKYSSVMAYFTDADRVKRSIKYPECTEQEFLDSLALANERISAFIENKVTVDIYEPVKKETINF